MYAGGLGAAACAHGSDGNARRESLALGVALGVEQARSELSKLAFFPFPPQLEPDLRLDIQAPCRLCPLKPHTSSTFALLTAQCPMPLLSAGEVESRQCWLRRHVDSGGAGFSECKPFKESCNLIFAIVILINITYNFDILTLL